VAKVTLGADVEGGAAAVACACAELKNTKVKPTARSAVQHKRVRHVMEDALIGVMATWTGRLDRDRLDMEVS
jgi:hypothetical protein